MAGASGTVWTDNAMRVCTLLIGFIAAAWLGACALFLIGQFGLFGQERDPLAAVLFVILGQPWVRGIDAAPEAAWPWLAALAPGINLILALLLCRALGRRKQRE